MERVARSLAAVLLLVRLLVHGEVHLSDSDVAWEYTLCLSNGSTSTQKLSLHEATLGGTRLVAIANYFKGCQGGRVEASGYSQVQQAAELSYPGQVAFFTNIADGPLLILSFNPVLSTEL